MGTGKQRLADKNISKKKALESALQKKLAELDGENTQKSAPEQKSKCKVRLFKSDPHELTELEKKFFDDIMAKVCEIHKEEAEKFILSAKNLAKLYAMQKRLKTKIEEDGGEFLESPDGKIYAHPGLKIMQQNYSLIITNLKALGIVAPRANKTVKKDDDALQISEFAQF